MWLFVAVTFLHARYAPINPVAAAGAWAFALQGLALAALGVASAAHAFPGRDRPALWRQMAGALFVAWGVALLPAWALWRDGTLDAAQWFGMAPDPTAIATVGFVLAAVRSRAVAAALLVVPLLWCLLSALTLRAMDERQMMGGGAAHPSAVLFAGGVAKGDASL